MSFVKVFEFLNDDKNPFRFSLIGKIIDNEDPDKAGRVKVEIPALYEGSKDEIPWASCKTNSPVFDVPEVGTYVYITLSSDDPYSPVYTGRVIPKNTKADFSEDYPNTYGISDSAGNKILINKTKKTIKVIHSSGSNILIDQDGNLNTAFVDLVSTLSGKFTITSSDNASIESEGEAKFFGKSKTEIGDSSSVTVVQGQLVSLGAEGGLPVAVLSSQAIGIGNLGGPVNSIIVDGSSKVSAVK